MTLVSDSPAASQTTDWDALASAAIDGRLIDPADALAVLAADDSQTLAILHAAFRVRRHHFGTAVKLNMIVNAKSGHCPEDCGYCSQSKVSTAPIETYAMMDRDSLLDGAREAVDRKAGTYCIVCSGRGPTPKTLDTVTDATRAIKDRYPNLKICACLGILRPGQAEALADAGVDRYNHNINTSAAHHATVTSTHGYDHRVATVEKAKGAGISPCSGVIIGMGESHADIVDMATALREIGSESVPVNFLVPVEGTPMAEQRQLTPMYCLRVLALFRFICPSTEIRVSGGREVNLRSLQPLSLFAANSVFVGDYLTTDGQAAEADHAMIRDLGFTIDGYED